MYWLQQSVIIKEEYIVIICPVVKQLQTSGKIEVEKYFQASIIIVLKLITKDLGQAVIQMWTFNIWSHYLQLFIACNFAISKHVCELTLCSFLLLCITYLLLKPHHPCKRTHFAMFNFWLHYAPNGSVRLHINIKDFHSRYSIFNFVPGPCGRRETAWYWLLAHVRHYIPVNCNVNIACPCGIIYRQGIQK